MSVELYKKIKKEEKIGAYEKELFNALHFDMQRLIKMIRIEDIELAEYIQKNIVINEQDFIFKYVGDSRFHEWIIRKILCTSNVMDLVKKLKFMFN